MISRTIAQSILINNKVVANNNKATTTATINGKNKMANKEQQNVRQWIRIYGTISLRIVWKLLKKISLVEVKAKCKWLIFDNEISFFNTTKFPLWQRLN